MEVRKAVRSDLLGVGRVIHASAWETYPGLLKPSTVSEVLATSYSPSALKRRLLEGGLLVAVDDRKVVIGVAAIAFHEDFIEVEALFSDPEYRWNRVASNLVEALDVVAAGLPICYNVLLGSIEGEKFSEHLDFVPGETVSREVAGQQIVERRWWRTND